MSEQLPTFARRLKQFREEAGITMYALSKISGVSKQVLSRLEMGLNEPSWLTVQRIALALGKECQAFMDSSDPDIQPRVAERDVVDSNEPAADEE